MALGTRTKSTTDEGVDTAPAQHVESQMEQNMKKPDQAVLEALDRGQGATGFESLTLWETAKTFKKAVLICTACALIGALDGYQVG